MSYTTQLQIQFYDQAERLYVEEGLSPQAIRNVLVDELTSEGLEKADAEDEAPSRRTLYNWSQEGEWKSARRRFLQETEDIRLTMREAIRVAASEAIANPNRDTFSALRNAVSGAKGWEQLQGLERAAETAGEDKGRDDGDAARDALAIVMKALEGK
mgnify:FL=1